MNIIFIVMMFLFAISIYLYKYKIILWKKFQNFTTFSLTFFTIFLAIYTWFLAKSTQEMAKSAETQITLSKKQSEFELRPYVSMNLINFGAGPIPELNAFSIGGEISFNNYGKVPASKIKTNYYITTDVDPGNRYDSLNDYAECNWGGLKKISFLGPNEREKVALTMDLSPVTKLYYINGIVSYEGIEADRTYWTSFKKVIRIIKDNHGYRGVEIDSFGDWDRNNNFNPPKLEAPDFRLYQGKKDRAF